MRFDSAWLFGFACVFVRCSALVLASPVFGGSVPTKVRVMFAAIVGLALTPPLLGSLPTPPEDLGSLVLTFGNEVGVGVVIGMCIQFMLLGAQMAGAFLDMQLGFGTMQMFNPQLGAPVTILGNLKFMLGLVLFFLLNGHHMMFKAFFESYQIHANFGPHQLADLRSTMIPYIGQISMIALQLAAPAAGVAIIVDGAASLINKAIPNLQVYFLTAGAKSTLGILALTMGLPIFVSVMQSSTEFCAHELARILSGLR